MVILSTNQPIPITTTLHAYEKSNLIELTKDNSTGHYLMTLTEAGKQSIGVKPALELTDEHRAKPEKPSEPQKP